MQDKLSHIDKEVNPGMVDVSGKGVTSRTAVAQAVVILGEDIMKHLENGEINTKKGPVFDTAIIAGTMGAKNTSTLIPFCHPLSLDNCKIKITTEGDKAIITCSVSVEAKTGVEMEALTGASVAALTIYDMCKALSHNIVIGDIHLLEKKGGKSHFKYEDNEQKDT